MAGSKSRSTNEAARPPVHRHLHRQVYNKQRLPLSPRSAYRTHLAEFRRPSSSPLGLGRGRTLRELAAFAPPHAQLRLEPALIGMTNCSPIWSRVLLSHPKGCPPALQKGRKGPGKGRKGRKPQCDHHLLAQTFRSAMQLLLPLAADGPPVWPPTGEKPAYPRHDWSERKASCCPTRPHGPETAWSASLPDAANPAGPLGFSCRACLAAVRPRIWQAGNALRRGRPGRRACPSSSAHYSCPSWREGPRRAAPSTMRPSWGRTRLPSACALI